ncbi:uncharacterized protein AB675_11726 [Cyphellophora attinorum]|uniref:RRM domain-containing protein n=1 Tax=Cyphellophora attinorum TaxID=1664694 RepID=A0A0N1H472_9EURO|nr:uncharacterized protein AB675_11726 [Phialophora attinorum]KPI35417.1 hypothetical protein AB675_11726 [Phialophora attinorum]
MAEVIGIVAAVFQIADLGARLSVKLYTFSHKVKHAKNSVEAISKDISMTGNVLRQLGTELKKEEYAKLCTAEALKAAQSLVDECHGVFSDIDAAMGNANNPAGIGGKVVMSFKNRLRFPYVQQQVEALQANLDRLKNSLLVMLNVLILAGQLKSQTALPLLQEQKDLLTALHQDQRDAQQRFEDLTKRLESVSTAPNAQQQSVASVADQNPTTSVTPVMSLLAITEPTPPPVLATAMTTSTTTTTTTSTILAESQSPAVPFDKSDIGRSIEVSDHCRLVETLIDEINLPKYEIRSSLRDQAQEAVFRHHFDSWKDHFGRLDIASLEAWARYQRIKHAWMGMAGLTGSVACLTGIAPLHFMARQQQDPPPVANAVSADHSPGVHPGNSIRSTTSDVSEDSPIIMEAVDPGSPGVSDEKKSPDTSQAKIEGNVLAYINNVNDKVDARLLREALEKHGELRYFDVSQMRNCAFVEFATPAGYAAAVAANPHAVGTETITVEERRPHPNAYGGANDFPGETTLSDADDETSIASSVFFEEIHGYIPRYAESLIKRNPCLRDRVWRDFIKNNPNAIADASESRFYFDEAEDVFRKGNIPRTISCIRIGVVLLIVGGKKSSEYERLFDILAGDVVDKLQSNLFQARCVSHYIKLLKAKGKQAQSAASGFRAAQRGWSPSFSQRTLREFHPSPDSVQGDAVELSDNDQPSTSLHGHEIEDDNGEWEDIDSDGTDYSDVDGTDTAPLKHQLRDHANDPRWVKRRLPGSGRDRMLDSWRARTNGFVTRRRASCPAMESVVVAEADDDMVEVIEEHSEEHSFDWGPNKRQMSHRTVDPASFGDRDAMSRGSLPSDNVEVPAPRKGITKMPKGLIHTQVLNDLAMPITRRLKDENNIIISNALSPENIEAVPTLSKLRIARETVRRQLNAAPSSRRSSVPRNGIAFDCTFTTDDPEVESNFASNEDMDTADGPVRSYAGLPFPLPPHENPEPIPPSTADYSSATCIPGQVAVMQDEPIPALTTATPDVQANDDATVEDLLRQYTIVEEEQLARLRALWGLALDEFAAQWD